MPDAELLTATQVAEKALVHPETVRRWTREGRLAAVILPSGHKRYRSTDVEALLTPTARVAESGAA